MLAFFGSRQLGNGCKVVAQLGLSREPMPVPASRLFGSHERRRSENRDDFPARSVHHRCMRGSIGYLVSIAMGVAFGACAEASHPPANEADAIEAGGNGGAAGTSAA